MQLLDKLAVLFQRQSPFDVVLITVFWRAAADVEQRLRDGPTGTLKGQFCAMPSSEFPLSSHRFRPRIQTPAFFEAVN
jgi:hypothetical protein